MGFWGGLFGGSNSVLNKDIDQAGAISSFATGVGEGGVTAANKFYQDVLQGGTAEAQALAPEIGGIQKREQEQKLQGAEFGTRSGGTAAYGQAADAAVNADILNLEGGMKQGAAGQLASIGTTEQGIGLSANQQQARLAQERMQNQQNSILGRAITGVADAGESMAGGELGTFASTLGSGNYGW